MPKGEEGCFCEKETQAQPESRSFRRYLNGSLKFTLKAQTSIRPV